MGIIFGPNEVCLLAGGCKYHTERGPCYGTLERDAEFFCGIFDIRSDIEIPSIPEIKIKGKVLLHG